MYRSDWFKRILKTDNSNMKTLFYFITFAALTSLGCKKSPKDSHQYMSRVEITGPDLAMCPCCGGLKFHFISTEDTLPNVDRLNDEKNILGITSATKYPLSVKLDWTSSSKCSGRYINVTRVSK